MRIIIDESTSQKVRRLIEGEHVVPTTVYQGWSGLKNGVLLKSNDDAGFGLLISSDQEMNYQQNF